MQRDAGALHAHGLQSIQQGLVEMQRRRGCSGSTWVFGKHGLVARHILGAHAVFVAGNVGRQRHMAVCAHQMQGLIAESKAKQRPILMRPTAQQRGFKSWGVACLVEHLQHRAHGRFFAHPHVRHHLVDNIRQDALDQQLELPAAWLFAKQTRWHHLRVVEHQQVAGFQQCWEFFEHAVDSGVATAIQQTRATALG